MRRIVVTSIAAACLFAPSGPDHARGSGEPRQAAEGVRGGMDAPSEPSSASSATLAEPAPTGSPMAASEVEIEVIALDSQGRPLEDLDRAGLRLLEGGETRPGWTLEPLGRPRHLLLVADLPSAPPGLRHRALPPVRTFLLRRLGRGDRVTVAALRADPRGPEVRLLCRFCSDPAEVADAIDRLEGLRPTAFRAEQDRAAEPADLVRQAFRASARALSLVAGDGRHTAVLYLGRALTSGVAESRRPGGLVRTRPTREMRMRSEDMVGSVQYLVSMPRYGPLEFMARGEGDLLLASAIQGGVSLYPLVDGRGTGARSAVPGGRLASRGGRAQDFWLATETGGRTLTVDRLDSQLEHLDAELDAAHVARFRSAP
ncbi:MAG: hypothetical protein MI919_37945, partial [Holophagales bacterium]|nr:hypothetical protein [Holophagales bacterium]